MAQKTLFNVAPRPDQDPAPARRRRGKLPERDPRVTRVMALWRKAWKDRYGDPWIDNNPAGNRALIKRLLTALDGKHAGDLYASINDLWLAIDRLISGRLTFMRDRPSIGLLYKYINELLDDHDKRWKKLRDRSARPDDGTDTDWADVADRHA